MLPRFLRVELLRERVELRVALLERPLLGRAQPVLTTRVPSRSTVLVDLHVVAVAVRGKELDSQPGEKRMEPRLVGSDPLAPELVRFPAELGVPEASTDAVARFQHDDITPFGRKLACRSEPGHTGSDDGDVGLDQAGAHASLLSAAAAAARPVLTAPSMYPATHWSEPQT